MAPLAHSWLRPKLAKLLLAAGIIIPVGVAMKALEQHVLRLDGAPSAPVCARLVGRPAWMPATLAAEISRTLVPAGAVLSQPDLAQRVYARAVASPWIKSVRCVRKRRAANRRMAAVEVFAEYHRPVARVQAGRGYAYISDAGVRLPAGQVPKYEAAVAAYAGAPVRLRTYIRRREIPPGVRARTVHYIIIYGVRGPLPEVGQAWQEVALTDGLRLVKLVNSRKYARQITVVDVRNHTGRIDSNAPHLRMYAQTGRGHSTDIRFGRFPVPGGGDYVVLPQRKLSYIDRYVAGNGGRLAGINTYLDLRYDQLHVSIN